VAAQTCFLGLVAVITALLAPMAWAQGGPPFLSDDPDTPGNNHWEINLVATGERNPFAGAYEVPNIDLNYGIGHRIQLKYELPLSVAEERGDTKHVAAGLGNSLLGVKYRFYAHHPRSQKGLKGERESIFGLSTYPQLLLSNPTRSVARDVVEPGPQFLLPLEGNAKLGPIRVSGEVGRWFGNNRIPDSWIRGLIVGHEFGNKLELYGEFYDQQAVRATADEPETRETTLGIGTRIALVRNESIRFMAMAGRTFLKITPANHQPSWIAELGFQFLVGPKRHSSDLMEPEESITPGILRH
jgi:hypothetical protein